MDNMEAIKAAFQQLKAGTGSFDQLKAAVMEHDFTVIDTKVRSVQELAERWDYAPVAGSFRDTIEVLRWGKVLTKEQVEELRAVARL